MPARVIVIATFVAVLLVPVRASAQQAPGELLPVKVSGGTATVTGTVDGGSPLHVYVDGEFVGSTEADPGFDLSTPATPGEHEACVYQVGQTPEDNALIGCDDYDVAAAPQGPWVALSSDFHVSSPGGRWQENDDRLAAFVAELTSYSTAPELLMVAGDMVDNVTVDLAGRPSSGSFERWQADVARYQEIMSGLGDIPMLHALGPGHDFGGAISQDLAEAAFGRSRGFVDWEGGRIIWLDSSPSPLEVRWLDRLLDRTAGESVLVFHVPVSTTATSELDEQRVLPTDNGLYDVIANHSDSLGAIVNGHIHTASASMLLGVPVHLCPLIDSGSYCRLVATDEGAVVERAELKPWR